MRDWPSLALRFPAAAGPDLADRVAASFDADAVAAIHERDDGEWVVAFRDAAARDAARPELQAAFGASGLTVRAADISDEDWARRSQAGLGAVCVGRLLVAPPWAMPGDADPDLLRLVIEPSMGFGSGHHATTRMCLQALQAIDLAGATVLDIGTGSGILAIAAAALGASAVVGAYIDPDALDAARAAAAANASPPSLAFVEADFRRDRLGPAGVVVANLTGAVIAGAADDLIAAAVPGGTLILSGLTAAEAPLVLDAFAGRASLDSRRDEDGWVAVALRVPA